MNLVYQTKNEYKLEIKLAGLRDSCTPATPRRKHRCLKN